MESPKSEDRVDKEDSYTIQKYAANANFDTSAEDVTGQPGPAPDAGKDNNSLMNQSPNAEADDATNIMNVAEPQIKPVDSSPTEALDFPLAEEQKPKDLSANIEDTSPDKPLP